ncbi:hypothetical protein AG1IA_03415 [Rhizoctonia solani AG-1 IA]|uniref:Uncharacterized protein n=1 Tax=Thanatephorus cucumeris (strain AG1-IA) TaxID=983506 RepID=L8X0J2_THACA|nr:hypothetical protein AG1IA_03415 [Rhizoctonia solani AG-1 IA]
MIGGCPNKSVYLEVLVDTFRCWKRGTIQPHEPHLFQYKRAADLRLFSLPVPRRSSASLVCACGVVISRTRLCVDLKTICRHCLSLSYPQKSLAFRSRIG